MINYLPFDLQQVICHYGIGQNAEKPFVQTAILVNKSWATFVCRILYR
jgi:hypothetical protein